MGGMTTTTQGFPQTLLRVGALEHLELRVALEGVIWESTKPGGNFTGWGDGELGTKILLWRETDFFPQVAVLSGVSVPWGSGTLSSE